MFWAMMYLLLFGGSADNQLAFFPGEKKISRAIDDPRRREQIVEILGEVKSAEQVLFDAYENRYADLAELSLHHDADREQFREVLAGLEKTRLDVQGAWLDSRFRLKKHLTRAEWESIYGKQ